MKPFDFILVANGISCTREDVAALLDHSPQATVVAVNDAWRLLPERAWVDGFVVYGCDYRWWAANYAALDDMGRLCRLRLTINEKAARDFPRLYLIPCADLAQVKLGLAPADTGAIHHGYSSGFQALHVAINDGGKRIALIGYDYGAGGAGHAVEGAFAHEGSDYTLMRTAFVAAAPQIVERGVSVVNFTRRTLLHCFERATVSELASDAGAAQQVEPITAPATPSE